MIRPRLLLIPVLCSAVVVAVVLLAGWEGYSEMQVFHPPLRVLKDLELITQAAEQWKRKIKAYPPTLDDLARLERGSDLNDFESYWPAGPIVDPWGRPYLYEVSASGLRVRTLGADGLEGGGGESFDYSEPTTPDYRLLPSSPLGEYLASKFFVNALVAALLAGAAANVLCFGALWSYVRRPRELEWAPALGAATVAIIASLAAGSILISEALSGH